MRKPHMRPPVPAYISATLLALLLVVEPANAFIRTPPQAASTRLPMDVLSTASVDLLQSLGPVPLASASVVLAIALSPDDPCKISPFCADDKYDAVRADAFYRSKPLFVLKRILKLMILTGGFAVNLMIDWNLKEEADNEAVRAKEALALITQLGPTFIKLGQALSIRSDILPPAYVLEFRKLQDSVPPFPADEAKEIVRRELGVQSLSEVFRVMSDKPIASASIGQVFKATLLDGREVAVKVQRPGILGAIALDLHILRLLTPIQVAVVSAVRGSKATQADVSAALSLVDEWGRGFVAEVDYRLEAANTEAFIRAMEKRGLHAVTAPTVVLSLSSGRVLVTEWMAGTRLDRDASTDVPRLCSVAVNAYLTMLLDTGTLHCDPHPGNLLRTLDGRLCILDWGMTLAVPSHLQYSLLEFIAHVNTEDYDALLQDFINLGFSPPGKLEELRASGLTEGIAFTFRQLNKGGGATKMRERVGIELRERYGDMSLSDAEVAAKTREEMMSLMQVELAADGEVDVSDVTGVMEQVSRRNRDLFSLPPYILYLSRAFSTLEGIGLTINSEYSILQECYPYLARRLFADNSPRAKEALRTMLFSRSAAVSPDKLVEMSKGFSSYTSAVVATERDIAGMREAEQAFVDLLLAREGNALQDILIEEATRVTDALVREGVDRSYRSLGGQLLSIAIRAPLKIARALVPWPFKRLTEPLQLPFTIGKGAFQLAKKSEEDEGIISTLRAFATLPAARRSAEGSDGVTLDRVLAQLRSQLMDDESLLRRSMSDPQIRKRAPLLSLVTRKFTASLLTRFAERVDQSTGVTSTESAFVALRDPRASVTDKIAFVSAKGARAVSDIIRPMSGGGEESS